MSEIAALDITEDEVVLRIGILLTDVYGATEVASDYDFSTN